MSLKNYLKIKSREEVIPRGDLERSGKAGRGLTSRSDFKNFTKYFFVALILFLSFTIFSSDAHAATIVRATNASGLVGYWNFDVDAGGTTVLDMSGQGNDGVMTDMDPATDWVDGKVGSGAMDFDGSDDYIETNYVLPTTNLSYGAWGKSSATGFDNRMMGNADATGGLSGADIIWGATSANQIYVVTRNGANNNSRDIIDAPAPNLGTGWHHIFVTISSTEGAKLYYDGNLIGSKSSATAITSSLTTRIGRDGNGTSAFNGQVDDVRLYNRALSASEITNLYNSQKAAFPTVSKPTLSDGLVGYWNFDTGVGGSTVYDMSPGTTTNNGTMTNMDPSTDWVDGKVGSGAMDFDGSDDYVTLGDVPAFELDTFTISGWVKRGGTGTEDVIASLQYQSNAAGGLSGVNFYFGDTNTLRLDAYISDSNERVETVETYTDTDWHYVLATKSGVTLTMYVDGIQVKQGNLSSATVDYTHSSTQNSAIGGRWRNTSQDYHGDYVGSVDDVRIYNRALSADEVQRLYKATAGTKISSGLSKGLVGHWNFDDETGTLARDISGNENNGTLTLMDPATDWVAGKIGTTSLDFDGSNDGVWISNTSGLIDPNEPYSVTAWINSDDISQAVDAVYSQGKTNDTIANNVFILYTHINTIQFNNRNDGDTKTVQLASGAILANDTWYHVVITYDGTTNYTLYSDGVIVDTGTDGDVGTAVYTNTTVGIRNYISTGDTDQFNGTIDDVRIYNRALSADEVYRLYKLR